MPKFLSTTLAVAGVVLTGVGMLTYNAWWVLPAIACFSAILIWEVDA